MLEENTNEDEGKYDVTFNILSSLNPLNPVLFGCSFDEISSLLRHNIEECTASHHSHNKLTIKGRTKL